MALFDSYDITQQYKVISSYISGIEDCLFISKYNFWEKKTKCAMDPRIYFLIETNK